MMSGLGLTKRRLRRQLRAVIELEAEKGEPSPTIALLKLPRLFDEHFDGVD